METKMCAECGRELPVEQFRRSRWGSLVKTCNECEEEKKKNTRKAKTKSASTPYTDPAFDGKTPREVMDMMSRAKKWLESRGYRIELSGYYEETIRKTMKF